MLVISNYTNDKLSITTTISINSNIILLLVHSFIVKRNTRFKVFWSPLCFFKHKYLLSNLLAENGKLLPYQ